MESLREYSKDHFVEEITQRCSKMAKMVSTSDYVRAIERAILRLDEILYYPRNVLLKQDSIFRKEEGYFIDVTELHVDEICAFYYPSDYQIDTGWTEEIGLLPYISSSSSVFSMMDTVSGYLNQMSNINKIVRNLQTSYDFELFPVSADGRQYLQVRKDYKLCRIEYLPHIDPIKPSWFLYQHEYRFVSEMAYLNAMKQNAEYMFSASPLGMKESEAVLNYWDKQEKDLDKQFTDARVLLGVF